MPGGPAGDGETPVASAICLTNLFSLMKDFCLESYEVWPNG